jgi:hypothetical protein
VADPFQFSAFLPTDSQPFLTNLIVFTLQPDY